MLQSDNNPNSRSSSPLTGGGNMAELLKEPVLWAFLAAAFILKLVLGYIKAPCEKFMRSGEHWWDIGG